MYNFTEGDEERDADLSNFRNNKKLGPMTKGTVHKHSTLATKVIFSMEVWVEHSEIIAHLYWN
jgi:hypothetical protein